jgi:hypothetical protein
MAITETKICNMALTRLGHDQISSLTENTKGASLCSLHYDVCRDALLRAHPWNFAIARAALAQEATTPNHEYSYRYTLPIAYPVRFLDDTEIVSDKDTGLIEVDGVPAGFLRISTRLLRAMVDHYWHLKYEDTTALNWTAWSLFDFQLVDGRYWGEDFVFCRRLRAMGGKIWVDPYLTFSHIGAKGFQGSLAEWLRAEVARNSETVTEIKPRVRVKAGVA